MLEEWQRQLFIFMRVILVSGLNDMAMECTRTSFMQDIKEFKEQVDYQVDNGPFPCKGYVNMLQEMKDHYNYENQFKIPLEPMGVLAPGSAHARPSARPPIDTSGNFPEHMSAGSPSNISPNPSEVISEVSEP